MAEYIEREALKRIYMLKGKDKLRLATVINELEMLPAADVVPRAEVEKEYGNALQTAFNEGKLEGEKEVAREIFAEIERNMVAIDDVDFNRFRAIGARTFAELKKKYTEGADER